MNPEVYDEYIKARDIVRIKEVQQILAAMTKRERLLVREIAVMAAVQARIASGVRTPPPHDGEVLYHAILGCIYTPDLYPTFRRLKRIAFRRAKKAGEEPSG